jgi:predicted dehydrogenase
VLGIDIDDAACELARKSGADAAVDTASAQAACDAFTDGRGADCVVIAAATRTSEPIELAARIARDRARVVVVGLVGMDVPRELFYAKEIELRLSRSYGPGRYDAQYEEKGTDYPIGYVRWTEKRNMEAFLQLVAEKKINTELLTTQRFHIDRATDAYELIVNRGERYCGVVLEYPQSKVERTPAVAKTVKPLSADQIGVSFIGAGNFARGVLLPIVKRQPKLKLVSVATTKGLTAKNTADQFGFSQSTTDYQEILADENSQVVFIATRHDSHAQIAADGLRRGKHVFVEKPLAITEDSLREVMGAARESSGVLMVGYNRRFSPLAREIKVQFESRIGPMTIVYRVNAGQLASDHWTHDGAEGGGRILGEVCHFIDFVQLVTGALPSRVYSERVGGRATGAIDDSAVISLSLSEGSIATIVYTASGDSSVPKEHVEIFCDGSVATIDDFKSGSLVRDRKTTRLGGRTQDKGHANEIAAFFESIRARGDSPIALQSLAATTLASLAAVESANTGRAVTVDLGPIFS